MIGEREDFTVYRHFDANGVLLYVGNSYSMTARTIMHLRSAQWRYEIASIPVEHFTTLRDAENAERIAILDEKPLYNVLTFSPSRIPPVRQGTVDENRKATFAPEDCLYGTREAGDYLCKCSNYIGTLIKNGTLPGFMGPDRRYYLVGRDLIAYRDKLIDEGIARLDAERRT